MASESDNKAELLFYSLLWHPASLRELRASVGFKIRLADVLILYYVRWANDNGLKCGFMAVFHFLRSWGKTRALDQIADSLAKLRDGGYVERRKKGNVYENINLKLTPSGRMLISDFEGRLLRSAKKGLFPVGFQK